MSLRLRKKSKSQIPPVEAGTYPAVCVGIIDLGEQFSEKFKKFNDKLLIIWEIPSQTVSIDGEDKPRWLSREFTTSLNPKCGLYTTLVSWRGAAFTEQELQEDTDGFTQFNVLDMLGKGCFLQVIVEENDRGRFNRVTSVIALPAGMEVPATKTPLMAFDMGAWDDDVFKVLPEWIQEKIKKSTEYQEEHVPTDAVDVDLSGTGGDGDGEENPI